MSSSITPEHSMEKVAGKRVQKDVGGEDSSKLPKLSSSIKEDVGGTQSYVDEINNSFEEFVKKYTSPPYTNPRKIQTRDTNHPDPVSGGKICKACRRYYCDRNDVDSRGGNCPRGTFSDPKNRFLTAIPGMLVPSFAWPFVDEMVAKSDDKTLVVSHITREIRKETDFLKLFERLGEVSDAKLAPLDHEGTLRGEFGFVTFVNKEDAQKAIDTLNASPLGRDNRIIALDWASTLKKQT